MLKKRVYLFGMLWILILILMVSACAESTVKRSVLLITEYQQMGWGERFQLGVVDSDGNLWTYETEPRGDIPYAREELVTWAETTDQLQLRSTISRTDLMDLMSLVQTVPMQEVIYANCACDAGEQTSWAVRKARDGKNEIIILGASGDDVYENTDPSAQSLYQTMRSFFPWITSYEGEAGMAPAGFPATDILSFCGFDGAKLTGLVMHCYTNDCEECLKKTTPLLTAEEIMRLTVTGKKNAMSVTGNTTIYQFVDENGNQIASFEFYENMLIRSDGMYSLGNR